MPTNRGALIGEKNTTRDGLRRINPPHDPSNIL